MLLYRRIEQKWVKLLSRAPQTVPSILTVGSFLDNFVLEATVKLNFQFKVCGFFFQVMTKNETEMCLNTISPQLDVESNCFDDASFSQASEISIFGEYGTMAIVYGSSGAYYRLVLKMLELLFGLDVRLEIDCSHLCNSWKVTIRAVLGIS